MVLLSIKKEAIATQGKAHSQLSMFYREHKELLALLAPDEKTRVICCSAKLINYIGRWMDWKKLQYPTQWIYQTLKDIYHDLMGEHTIHVIRSAIALLNRLGFLSVRKNDRATNWRNGQDRTHQYYLHGDRIEAALRSVFGNKEAQTLETNPFVNIETPSVNPEIPSFIVETYTQIPSTDSCTLSQHSEREPESLLDKPENSQDGFPVKEDELENPATDWKKEPLTQENKNPGEDKYFAGSPVITKQKLRQYKKDKKSLQGFNSLEERDGFYQELLVLAKNKSGVISPAGWANQIIKSVNAGQPCEYLNEYRRGEAVGSCDQQEWEAAPGFPFPAFTSYLVRSFESNQMTPEQATQAVFKAFRDVHQARALWEGYKRHLANLKDEWQKQEALGVSNAYIPAEMMPHREVTLSDAAAAMQVLQNNSCQTKNWVATSAPVKELASSSPPVLESVTPEYEPESACFPNQEKPDPEKINYILTAAPRKREELKSTSELVATKARFWVRSHADLLQPIQENGKIVDFEFKENLENVGLMVETHQPISLKEEKPGEEIEAEPKTETISDPWADSSEESKSASDGKNILSKPRPQKKNELDMGALYGEVMGAESKEQKVKDD